MELLDEAKERCKATITERKAEKGEEITGEELERTAAIMGYGAVKYADLKNNRATNYKFSFDDMLNLQGEWHEAGVSSPQTLNPNRATNSKVSSDDMLNLQGE